MVSNFLNFLKRVFRTSTKGYNVEEKDGLVYRTGSPNTFSGNVHYKQDYRERKGSSFIGYKEGLRHGMTKKYFFYERYESEFQYPPDLPLRKQIQEICEYKEGKKHGIRKLYEELGGIIRKENYKEGKLHGPVHVYKNSNYPEVYGNYDNGKLVPYESHHKNGLIFRQKSWIKDEDSDSLLKDGEWVTNLPYGEEVRKEIYLKGVIQERSLFFRDYLRENEKFENGFSRLREYYHPWGKVVKERWVYGPVGFLDYREFFDRSSKILVKEEVVGRREYLRKYYNKEGNVVEERETDSLIESKNYWKEYELEYESEQRMKKRR